ncbi:hypothetical protein pb186bvf_009235 [Paramecium bursaria]
MFKRLEQSRCQKSLLQQGLLSFQTKGSIQLFQVAFQANIKGFFNPKRIDHYLRIQQIQAPIKSLKQHSKGPQDDEKGANFYKVSLFCKKILQHFIREQILGVRMYSYMFAITLNILINQVFKVRKGFRQHYTFLLDSLHRFNFFQLINIISYDQWKQNKISFILLIFQAILKNFCIDNVLNYSIQLYLEKLKHQKLIMFTKDSKDLQIIVKYIEQEKEQNKVKNVNKIKQKYSCQIFFKINIRYLQTLMNTEKNYHLQIYLNPVELYPQIILDHQSFITMYNMYI